MPRTKHSSARTSRKQSPAHDWSEYSDEALLKLKINRLGVKVEGTPLQQRIEQLHDELAERGIHFRPHCWLSEEWFTPDGIPGIAIPFYLAHPRLQRLERKQMFEVEGGSQVSCMRILRHEAGHAMDNAYGLHRRREWQRVFGKSSKPYPDQYQPRPNSKSFVHHLGMWYAQAHPTEDFAETFAVWLKPRSNWRSQYRGWPALRKLEYIDQLMAEIANQKPRNSRRLHVDPVRTIGKTLQQHYEEKKARYGIGGSSVLDREILQLFSKEPKHASNPSATVFLRSIRRELREAIGPWTGQPLYTIDQALDELIDRCRDLKVRLRYSDRVTRRHTLVMLTVQTMNYLLARNHRVVL